MLEHGFLMPDVTVWVEMAGQMALFVLVRYYGTLLFACLWSLPCQLLEAREPQEILSSFQSTLVAASPPAPLSVQSNGEASGAP